MKFLTLSFAATALCNVAAFTTPSFTTRPRASSTSLQAKTNSNILNEASAILTTLALSTLMLLNPINIDAAHAAAPMAEVVGLEGGATNVANSKITTGGASTLQSGRTITITRGVNLDQSDFSNQNLKGVAFQQSVVRNANFKNANLFGASFFDATLDGSNFENADMTQVNLEMAQLSRASLKNAVMRDMYVGGMFLVPSMHCIVIFVNVARSLSCFIYLYLFLLYCNYTTGPSSSAAPQPQLTLHSDVILYLVSIMIGATIMDGIKDIENSDWTDTFLPKYQKKLLCNHPTAKGTNTKTGVDTRESLMCID